MADIYYDVAAFTAPLPNGLTSPASEVTPTSAAGGLKATGTPLYELVLSLDAAAADTPWPESPDAEYFILGGDGVAVELGSTWAAWAEAGSQ